MPLFLLVGAAAVVAIFHSILPDHWVPLAVVARTQRWSLLRVGRVTFLASLGHVIASLVLGGIVAVIGLRFQQEIDTPGFFALITLRMHSRRTMIRWK